MERGWKRMIYDGERVSLEQHVAKCIRTRKSMLDSWGYSSSGIWTDVDNNRVRFKNRGWRSVVVLSIGSAIFAFEITKRSAFDRRTLCPLEETANFVPIHKLQVRLMFSLGLPSSPRSFYFFKTIPNIGIFIFGTFFLNLKIFRIIIKRFFEFFLNSWLDFTHDRLIAFPFIELNKISYSIVFLRTNFNNDLSV